MAKEWDMFFYYGQSNASDEIRQDILNGVATSKKKLFFNRSDSAGVNDFENAPSGLAIEIGLKFAIIEWLAYRNTYTGTGTNGSKERRVASSQNEIKIVSDNIQFSDFRQGKTLTIPIGVY
jgi:hypothetical protein